MRIVSGVCVAIFFVIMSLSAAAANEYSAGGTTSVIGAVNTYTVTNSNESLIELARKFDLGYNEITNANADLDPFVPGEAKSVLIPSSWVLPDVEARSGIVINLSELRLYYFFKLGSDARVLTFPIGIGSEGTDTPVGTFRVMEKILHPAWHVPESIRKEKPDLPLVVPPGPDNPLGSHALRLSLPSILIHGTNRPFAIGRKASHGCIRLYPEDIPKLFSMVPKEVPVRIVRQPVKVGWGDGKVYIEVHGDSGMESEDFLTNALSLLAKKHLLGKVSSIKLLKAINDKSGLPVDISQDAAPEGTPAGNSHQKQPLREDLQDKNLFLLL
ncbi:MAG: L,D-transpeptidase family protein [Nitrospirae bacterium]|nr:L,D-transpeptidase family protein [Nitrospirota bacterium]